MEKYLRDLYKKFLKLEEQSFLLDAKRNSTSLKKLKISSSIIKKFYKNYRQPTFAAFLLNIKDIIYSKSVFDIIVKNASEDWNLWPYLKFLEKEKIIKVKKTSSPVLLNKKIAQVLPRPQTEKEIKTKIENKLKIKAKEEEFVVNLFKKSKNFEVKAEWDQMPISAGSAFFVVKKILEKLSLNKKFLFIGDDDFISVILSLADPNIESLVIDADEQVLESISFFASKFNLKIETRKVDIRKQKNLGEKFTGFLVNPAYTEGGVKEFVKFGKNQLGKDGGVAFLEIGDESIGSRFLFLQDFFTKNNLIIEELIKNKIYYPYIELYKEDEEILKRFTSIIDEKIIKRSPKLGAALYIFKYLPQKPKKIKFKKSIYAYL